MDKLSELILKCKASVSVTVNSHRDGYQTVEGYFNAYDCGKEDIEPEVFAKMVELDTIVDIHFYPNTPIGFFEVHHYDLDMALDECLRILKDEETDKK